MKDSVLTVVGIVAFYVVVFGALEVYLRWVKRCARHRHPSTAAYTADEAMWEAELNQPPTKETRSHE